MSILIIGGVVLVLLFTLLTLALPALEETFPEDHTSFLEMGIFPWFTGHSVAASLHGGLELLVLNMIMRLEYLRGHIGEKRFVHSRAQFKASAFQVQFCVAALFYRAVFLFFCSPACAGELYRSRLRSRSIYPISCQESSFPLYRRFLVMQGIFQSRLFKEKILVHGGL